jgi:3',5'-cyclic AMP phosphodiesterase CpdA
MKQIIHLSDIHVGYRDMRERFQEIARNLIARMQPASDYVVVITGDLVEKPEDDTRQYQAIYDVIADLQDADFTVLMVPGNHDYNDGLMLAERFVLRFKETFYADANVTYPKVDLIEDIAFLGLDTMAEELHWYDRLFADGELGNAQLQRLDSLLADSTVASCAHRVVYMHHHPFDPLPFSQLKDSEKLYRVLDKHGNIDVLLFGHKHFGRVRNGGWGIPRCYDGGTATGKKPGVVRHRLIDFTVSPTQDREINLFDVEG